MKICLKKNKLQLQSFLQVHQAMFTKRVNNILNYSPFVKANAFVPAHIISKLCIAAIHFDTNSGSTHTAFFEENSVRHIVKIFVDHKKYGYLDKFYGVAAEINLGGNAGVAIDRMDANKYAA
ncbi:hypothetical protein [Coleofasciculus sp. FACHB-129]|uniref:hypothetical protein n=1 Tax=Cyanophyceae TaxID=3028117 RepID=UPI001681E8A4|nr:hypothetical protein [Coleofasciculus sp. FACHB-129]MBD1896898.1 hypothetical protein [Coleofasciculus sp. FACHB-129]